ncbi:MAG: hypothetical protein KatS3mg124_1151 [Porticoccaceae bacterium]|nr:MAG: hypothetical protein KatS3mg124_1151 [Porticoccaceae bacterium]
MIRLLLLAALGFALWRFLQRLRALPAAERRRLLWRWLPLAVFALVLLAAVTGRIHWIGAAAAALWPLGRLLLDWLPRLAPLAALARRRLRPSTVRTAGLEITFDFARGTASGRVLAGPHAGAPLEALDREALAEQLAWFRARDRTSALLLGAYLVQRGILEGGQRPTEGSSLTEQQAREILGVDPGASREAIVEAHRRLIQKLHPDRGGNAYLAALVNAARDRLLEGS